MCTLMLGYTHTDLGWAVSHTLHKDWIELTLMSTPSLGHSGIHMLVSTGHVHAQGLPWSPASAPWGDTCHQRQMPLSGIGG